jgi:hypothetical protein
MGASSPSDDAPVVSKETEARLFSHAFPEREALSSVPSISSCTWPGAENEGRLDEALVDFIDALSDLNHELNGEVPSESTAADPIPTITTWLAYSVAVATRMLRTYGEKQQDDEVLLAAWRVETAWEAVLAGDIDDIAEHVADEERMRG